MRQPRGRPRPGRHNWWARRGSRRLPARRAPRPGITPTVRRAAPGGTIDAPRCGPGRPTAPCWAAARGPRPGCGGRAPGAGNRAQPAPAWRRRRARPAPASRDAARRSSHPWRTPAAARGTTGQPRPACRSRPHPRLQRARARPARHPPPAPSPPPWRSPRDGPRLRWRCGPVHDAPWRRKVRRGQSSPQRRVGGKPARADAVGDDRQRLAARGAGA